MHRRRFLSTTSAALAGAMCHSCSDRSSKLSLKVFTWADYLDPEVAAAFEQEFGCTLVLDTFDSNESMFAKIAAGATGYDVLVPTSYMVKTLVKHGQLQALDHTLLPNLAHVDPHYLRQSLDPEMTHSVAYMMAPTCIAWHADKVADAKASYAMFSRGDLKGRMTLLDDMREVLGAGLRSLGYRLNSTNPEELAKARDVVRAWKVNLAKFDNEQYKSGLASGEFHVVQGYAGDLLQVAEDNEHLVVAIPEEGGAITCDDLCIPKEAEQVVLAHQFINYLTGPEVAAKNMQYIAYRAPNEAAYRMLPEDFRGNPALFPSEEIFAKLEPMDDLGDALPLWTAMWDQVKAS
jgi:spermidine/putrescine transport system substrate-binding protein